MHANVMGDGHILTQYAEKYFGEYLSNDEINEICYNGDDKVFCENVRGEWLTFTRNDIDFKKIHAFAQTCASYKEDTIDEKKPILSCVLPTGERVQILIPPVMPKGRISVTIRKPSKVKYTLENYIDNGSLDKKTAEKFKEAVRNGKNIVVCGETGSGKTTFMKTLVDFIPCNERVITIEDVPELVFTHQDNVVSLFYPSEAKSTDLINSASLLKSCLRMKPDRILLAELRSGETYDFLNVISSGHNGSMTSLHAGDVTSAYNRLVMMSMQNEQARSTGKELILEICKRVIDVIIIFKKENGKRQVTEYEYDGVLFKRNTDGMFFNASEK